MELKLALAGDTMLGRSGGGGPRPLKLDFSHVARAEDRDADWIRSHLGEACREHDTQVGEEDGRPTVTLGGSRPEAGA